jgi:two-component system, chemotaxis family, chemotaxis protein CheY
MQVQEAMNGLEALERALAAPAPPGLLVVDVNMPGMDGYAFLRAARLDPSLAAVPAIMVTTEREPDDAARGFASGANLFLVKPVRPEVLAGFARALAGLPRQERPMTATPAARSSSSPRRATCWSRPGAACWPRARTRRGEPMNALFRALHTLKGTSGLFEIAPFTRLVHAGEDLLCAAQAGRFALDADLVDLLLATLDQLGGWVDALADGACLPGGADDASADLRAAAAPAPFGREGGCAGVAAGRPRRRRPPGWRSCRRPRWLRCRAGATLLALRYTPDEHCFFRGEDPLGLVRQLPGLCLAAASSRWHPGRRRGARSLPQPAPLSRCRRGRGVRGRGAVPLRARPARTRAADPPGWEGRAAVPMQERFDAARPAGRAAALLEAGAATRRTRSPRAGAAAATALRGAIAHAGWTDEVALPMRPACRRCSRGSRRA